MYFRSSCVGVVFNEFLEEDSDFRCWLHKRCVYLSADNNVNLIGLCETTAATYMQECTCAQVFSGGSDRAVLRNDDLLLLNSECDVSQVLPSCVSDARMMCDGVENCPV